MARQSNAVRVTDLEPEYLHLQPQDLDYVRGILEQWSARQNSSGFTLKSIQRDIRIVYNLVQYTVMPPWLWQEGDFEDWCTHLGVERRLANPSQRQYQSVIRKFLDYVVGNVKFRNDIRRKYGVEVRQICNDDNCIPHTVERELSDSRRAMTHEEITAFFAAIDKGILEATRFRSKSALPLRRDKAFWSTLYFGGLRISEGLRLNVQSFTPKPRHPELGEFGFIHVWGKGHKGSGLRYRQVPVDHITLPSVLDWYIEKVRPEFMLRAADANEEALFLSERGNRVRISTMEARFQVGLAMAGLEGLGLSPHCLRHSCGTHSSLHYSMEGVRRKLGHSSVAVTQTYLSVPDQFVEEEINHVIDLQIQSALNR